jgi:acetylornithine deacetylase
MLAAPIATDAAVDRARVSALASEAVRVKSYGGNEDTISDLMAQRLSEAGLSVEKQPVAPGRFNVIGTWRGAERGPSFMYNGHMDTNPAGEGWTRDPLGGETDAEFVYGIGISNMKAANASFLHAVEVLRETGFEPRGDLIVTYVIGELQGGIGTLKLLESGCRADYFVVGEPTELTLLTRHAASFVFEIWVYGSTRHLSKREEGIDAIAKMETILPRLRELKFSGAESDEVAELNRVHVGVIRAGMSREFLEWRPQQLADTCMVRGAGRFGKGQTLESAMRDLESFLQDFAKRDPAFRAEVKLVSKDRVFMPPFWSEPASKPARSVAKAHEAVTGEPPKIGAHTPAKFFGSDAAHLAAAGMTGLLYGPGGKFNTMPDERVSIDEMVVASKTYARVVADILGAGA